MITTNEIIRRLQTLPLEDIRKINKYCNKELEYHKRLKDFTEALIS